MQEIKPVDFDVIAEKDDRVLGWISKLELDQLQNTSIVDSIEDMKWATRITKRSSKTLKKILDEPFIKNQLDIEHGGCVYYSTGHGNQWKFIGPEFKKFVEDHPQYFIKGRF